MSHYKFFNNKETTLSTSLADVDTNLPLTSLTVDFLSSYALNYDERIKATLTNAGGSKEIIYLLKANPTGGPITSYTISRGEEGTSALNWVAGDTISLRITSAILDNFVQSHSRLESLGEVYSIKTPEIQQASYDAVLNSSTRPNSTSVIEGASYIDGSGSPFILYLQSGTTAASNPGHSGGVLTADGTTVGLAVGITSEGHFASTGVSLGRYGMSFGNGALAIGSNINGPTSKGAIALKDDSIAVGEGQAYGTRSLATFQGIAYGDDSISLGEFAFRTRAFTTKTIGARPINIMQTSNEDPKTNLLSIVWSYPVDFSGGSTWAATTSYSHGDVVKPTTPNGFQYIWIDGNYDTYTKAFPTTYTASQSGGTEPTWPTTEGSTVSDGGGTWVCRNNTGSEIILPSKFLTKRIGIVLLDASTITVQPQVSFGVTSANTAFLGATTTTNLTAVNKVQMFDILNSQLTDPVSSVNLNYTINTLGTATKMLGQIFFEGFLVEHWL